jgi:hypothetical protein
MNLPTSFTTGTQPVTSDGLSKKSHEAWQHLTDQGYEIHTGLTSEYADQILVMSHEGAIREYCPKDSAERFTDREAAEHWMAKGRAMFLLLKRGEGGLQLAGYGWSGPGNNAHVPDGRTTFALRIGETGQGQGLAAPFSWLVIDVSAAMYGLKDFWLETWGSNGAAVHIYHKLGFITVAEASGHRPTADGSQAEDTRIYMELPNRLLGS